MANYFLSGNDVAYLDATTIGRGDIGRLRTDAEAFVLAQYRRAAPDRRFTHQMAQDDITTGLENLSPTEGDTSVFLRWYHADAGDVGATADELLFLDAIRREIARMIVHMASLRPAGGGSSRSVKSETRGRRKVEYSEASSSGTDFPESFGSYLKAFDIRPATWVG